MAAAASTVSITGLIGRLAGCGSEERLLFMSSVSSLSKEFVKTLNSISQSRSKGNVFSDWLEIAAITLHQLPYHSGDFEKDETFETLESTYLDRIKRYSRDEVAALTKMFSLTLMAHKQEAGDFLGAISSAQELLNTSSGGQFFTPYPLCRALAKMTLHDAKTIYEEKGLITVSEPACGGGAMVIACAEELKDQELDPRSCVQFDCIDVSRDAFNMTYIQLSALDLQAVVRHGNTLSNEMWESRPTPQLRYFDQWLKEQQSWHRLEQLRELFINPEAFFDQATTLTDQENTGKASPAKFEEPQVNTDKPEQSPLFDMDTFADATPAESKRPRPHRQADITLPQPEQQMDLFSNDTNVQG